MTEQNQLPEIIINTQWCKGCAICVEFCPQNVLAMNGNYPEVVNLEACTACQLCDIRCPDFAITVRKYDSKKSNSTI
ncbi:4Fe-4S binding protein [candidate division KSB1 bacterium]|nr:4Fe-4S binding protein [candidate division KSB1 bacterium]